MPDYLDTSAFIKLVRGEPESRALRMELASGDARVSSGILLVEARRVAARYGVIALTRARAALATVTLLPIDDAVLESAASLNPPELRSLDALHLAGALSVADELDRMYCYDLRLATAAVSHGLDVRAPR